MIKVLVGHKLLLVLVSKQVIALVYSVDALSDLHPNLLQNIYMKHGVYRPVRIYADRKYFLLLTRKAGLWYHGGHA